MMSRYFKGKLSRDTETPGETIILNNGYVINPPKPRGTKPGYGSTITTQLSYTENFESYTEKHN
ncbi:MAG: hypothetical protein GX754_00610 [Clostridiaceae bacterium]|nr:hypothetical protein [Clostridiaceae bacterium]